MSPANQPRYFVPANHPFVATWKPLFDQFSKPDIHTFTFTVNPEIIDTQDVASVQQLGFAIQHQHHLIEKFVFAVNFKFRQIADSELYYQEQDWKSDPRYYTWFHKLSTQPHLLFFIQDHDARFYFLIGDWVAKGKLAIEENGSKPAKISLNKKQVEEMADRVFTCCRFFNLYCHGTGVNIQPYIESLIAEYNFDESNMYQMLCEQYIEDIQNGIKLQIVEQKNNP